MSKKSFMLASRFDVSEFMLATMAPRPATPTLVARKSSFSSNSAGFMVAVPPLRIMAAMAPVSPGMSFGSMYAPPLKVSVRLTSGNSLLGAM